MQPSDELFQVTDRCDSWRIRAEMNFSAHRSAGCCYRCPQVLGAYARFIRVRRSLVARFTEQTQHASWLLLLTMGRIRGLHQSCSSCWTAHNAKATFFVIGRYVRECPELVQETAARGHLIGNHTEMHSESFPALRREIRIELRLCHAAISNALARRQVVRPPFGLRNPWVIPPPAN